MLVLILLGKIQEGHELTLEVKILLRYFLSYFNNLIIKAPLGSKYLLQQSSFLYLFFIFVDQQSKSVNNKLKIIEWVRNFIYLFILWFTKLPSRDMIWENHIELKHSYNKDCRFGMGFGADIAVLHI